MENPGNMTFVRYQYSIAFVTHEHYFPGVWVWGMPKEVEVDGVKTAVLYLDTEGFESIGKSNVYDDR